MIRSPIPVEKHTINLYEGDFDKLIEIHPKEGASLVLRSLLRQYLQNVEARVGQMVFDEEEV